MKRIAIGIIAAAVSLALFYNLRQKISLTNEQLKLVGQKIFYNECSGRPEFLLAWNEGEDFMSLGIGHFIWYPQGKQGPFEESFPSLLVFMKEKGQTLPDWLQGPARPYCPWKSREDFLKCAQGQKAAQLRVFLLESKSLQLLFIIERLKRALPRMLKAAPKKLRPQIKQQFYRLASTPAGMYALIDYVNFKGEGILATERYQGQGWGLLQVLQQMQADVKGAAALEEFARTAERLLTERVHNAEPQRNEKRWLPGWKRRLGTYLEAWPDVSK